MAGLRQPPAGPSSAGSAPVAGGAPAAAPRSEAPAAHPQERQRHLHAVRSDAPAEERPEAAPEESRGQRSFRERHAATIAAAARDGSRDRNYPVDPQAPEPPDDWDDFVPEPEDEDIEDSALYGQAAVETILGGRVIDERPHHQS
ncbi:hypothetical protein NBM05_14605 [Rothia sp. AR01]|uniref:Uncharacterized protein n=1 Tax=Rothia santali TaxID=2949643 RepID=A0A9X2HF46_9MICC|nr:hypothetical protein [Rothia santali]MCP3427200.1 hypothetical protein [Rothia santali]